MPTLKLARLFRRKRDEEEIMMPSGEIKFDHDYNLPRNAREVYELEGVKIAITDRYTVFEPPKPNNFDEIVKNVMLRYMSVDGDSSEEERLLRAFLDCVASADLDVDGRTALATWYHIKNVCLRAGRITPLLLDPNIEDISCSGSGKPVYVYHSKYGYLPTNIVFSSEELGNFVHSIAQKAGFTLSYDNPVVDSTLYDGSRINITISVSREPSFSIRKVKHQPLTPAKLVADGTLSPEMAALLWQAVESRCSVMFIGGTAAGKTTTLNAAAFFIPANSKVVSIEDTYEILLPHKNWTPLITKSSMTQLDLVKVALRQRPEYLIVGEARGLEVREMFSAMGIGHTILTTFHGATPETVFRRLSGEPFLIKKDQLALLDFVVTMAFVGGKRRCVSIDLIGTKEGERLIGNLFSLSVANFAEGEFRVHRLEEAFARMAEKSYKSVAVVEREFKDKVKVVKHLPNDPKRFFAFLENLHNKMTGEREKEEMRVCTAADMTSKEIQAK